MASLESKSATKEIMEDEYAEYETKERIDDEYAENDQSKKRKCMTSKVPLGSTKVEDELNDATSDLSITSIGESPTSTKWEEIRKAVSTFLVCANLPFGTVESPAFRDMLQTLSPECKTLSQHAAKRLVMTDYLNESNFVLDELGEASGKISLTSDYWRAEHTHDECMCLSQLMMNTLSQHAAKRFVMADYLNERDFVLNELGEAPGKISLTSDYWRTEHTHDEYMCITAHWIDKDWKKQKRIIYFKAIELPFSGNSLADEVAMCLSEWKIDEKVCSITLDSSTNNDGMATCLKLKSSIHKGLFRDGMFFQVRCCRDILNCIVQAALEKVDNIVTKIRNGVKYLKKSAPRRKEFYDMAEKIFHLDTSRKLKTDMCLRWNSTYLMLEHGIYYQKVFQLWGQKDDTFGMFVLSDEEWKKIEAVHKFLEPFYDVICLISTGKNPTSDIFFVALQKIYSRLLKARKDPPEFMSDMITEAVQKFQNYWDEHYLLLSCAVVLDPRLKLDYIQFCFTKIYDNVDEHINTIVNTLEVLLNHYKEMSPVTSNSAIEGSGDSGSIRSSSDDFFKRYLQFVRSKQEKKSELQRYLDERNLPLDSDFDILDFWSKGKWYPYPTLVRLARDILAIPILIMGSESAFCIKKKVVNPCNCSLSEKTIQALVCLEDWYPAKGLTLGGSGILGTPLDVESSSSDDDDNTKADVLAKISARNEQELQT